MESIVGVDNILLLYYVHVLLLWYPPPSKCESKLDAETNIESDRSFQAIYVYNHKFGSRVQTCPAQTMYALYMYMPAFSYE